MGMMDKSLLVTIALVGLFAPSQQDDSHSRPHHFCPPDPAVTLKLTELENARTALTAELAQLSQRRQEFENEIQESSTMQWAPWGTWSGCTYSCNDGDDYGRIQTRERTRRIASGDMEYEEESRPCNTVQFARCINDDGAPDDFAVAYDYRDTLAIATCTGMNTDGRYVHAVRRECLNPGPTCDDICENCGEQFTCINAIHIYSPYFAPAQAHDELGEKSVHTFRYNACNQSYCGPNFCCCREAPN